MDESAPPAFVDTHCHIHEAHLQPLAGDDPTRTRWQKFNIHANELAARARAAGVTRLICVGCTPADSQRAVQFAATHQGVWASVGIHPHEAAAYAGKNAALQKFASLVKEDKVVAVGECGLDYYYQNSPKTAQEAVLRFQIELALAHNLPLIFHVRDAFDDFWRIFDEYKGIRGVIHSFTANGERLAQALSRGLYVGLNGIITFAKDDQLLDAARTAPLEKIVLETDAPFLTPQPLRGTINEPKHVQLVAKFLGNLRGETPQHIAAQTTKNARKLFGI